MAYLCSYLCSQFEIWAVALQAILLSQPVFMVLFWILWSIGYSLYLRNRKLLGGCLFVGSCLLGLQMISAPQIPSTSHADYLDIAVFNVNAYEGHQEELEDFLGSLDVDILFMIEKRAETIPDMHRIVDDFTQKRPKVSHNNAIFCKTDIFCSGWISEEIGSPKMSMPYLLLRLSNPLDTQQHICIIGVHAPPQVPIDASGMKPYIETLVSYIEEARVREDWNVCKKGDPIMLMGDLNAVPYSWAYEQIRKKGLRDALSFSGFWGRTWPNGAGFISFPFFRLDHIFVHPELLSIVEIQQFVSIPHSDHLGLRVRIPFSSTVQ